MRVIIVGSAGYVGSTLASRMKEQGHDVVGIDPCLPGVELELAADCASSFYCTQVNPAIFKQITKDKKVDAIVFSCMPEEDAQAGVVSHVRATMEEVLSCGVAMYVLNGDTSLYELPVKSFSLPCPSLYGYCKLNYANRAGTLINRIVAEVYETGQTYIHEEDGHRHTFANLHGYVDDVIEYITCNKAIEFRSVTLPTIQLTGHVIKLMSREDVPTCRAGEYGIHQGLAEVPPCNYEVSFTAEDQTTLARTVSQMILMRERGAASVPSSVVRSRRHFYDQLSLFMRHQASRKISNASEIAPVAPAQEKDFGGKWH